MSSAGSAFCAPPDAGFFIVSPGVQAACPLGTASLYGAGMNLSFCVSCQNGTYRGTLGWTSCLPCPAGSMTAAPGALACTTCPVGSYCPSGLPLACPPGFQPNTGVAAGALSCAACAAGSYTDGSAVLFCTPCPAGSYCPGAAALQRCPANTYNPAVGSSTACLVCGSGLISAAGAVACAAPTAFSPSGVATNTSLYCNASVALSTSVSLDRVITFPNGTTGIPPLLYLPSASLYNALADDIIVASPSACASFAITPGASQCDAGNTYALPSGTFFYLGKAASLGMTAAPNCGS